MGGGCEDYRPAVATLFPSFALGRVASNYFDFMGVGFVDGENPVLFCVAGDSGRAKSATGEKWREMEPNVTFEY